MYNRVTWLIYLLVFIQYLPDASLGECFSKLIKQGLCLYGYKNLTVSKYLLTLNKEINKDVEATVTPKRTGTSCYEAE